MLLFMFFDLQLYIFIISAVVTMSTGPPAQDQ